MPRRAEKWIKNDPGGFNWEPHLDHVVQTLEGEGKEEAKERQLELRKTI